MFVLPAFLPWRPIHWTSTEHVDMKMKNGLAGAGAGIYDRAITTIRKPRVICDARGHSQQMPQQALIALRRFVQRLKMFLRNHQQVRRRLRIDVANHKGPIVLMNSVGGYLSRNHPAK